MPESTGTIPELAEEIHRVEVARKEIRNNSKFQAGEGLLRVCLSEIPGYMKY
jgi:hypothetical protein